MKKEEKKGITAKTEIPIKIPVSIPIESDDDKPIDEEEPILPTFKTTKHGKIDNNR